MNFLSGLAKGGDQPKPKTDQPDDDKKSYDKVAAGATADLIGAASDYGKLDETKGVGKYADQAETYLRDYSAPAAAAAAAPEHKPAEVKVAPPAEVKVAPPAEVHVAPPAEAAAGGGVGDYVKKAQDYLNKPSGEGECAEKAPEEAGLGGDLMKKAGGFFK